MLNKVLQNSIATSAIRSLLPTAQYATQVLTTNNNIMATPALSRSFSLSSFNKVDAALNQVLSKELQNIRDAGTYKSERIIVSPQSAKIKVQSNEENKEVLNFCANNYLGLSDNQQLIDAGKKAMDEYGMGLSSVRFICGTQQIHKELEQKIADFHSTKDKKYSAILYPSCFDANASLFEALLTNEDAVISDELNHASIIDGIRLCKAERHRYKHMDLDDLENILKKTESKRLKMVVTDGVFSMDGDIAPLDDIADLCDNYGAILMIDECHGTGVIGKTGRGTPEYKKVMDRVDIINSTFGKALGGATGGYTVASEEVVDILRQRGRPYLFSNSLAPVTAACAIEAINILNNSNNLISKLQENTVLFRTKMKEAGFEIGGKEHAIAPVMLGEARLASEFADAMLSRSIYVIGFSYPVVPKGLARIRVQLSAGHTTEQVEQCIDSFIEIGKEKGVIS